MTAKRTRKKPIKVCMLGYAEETRDLVFGLPEDAEIWGINMAHVFLYGPKGLKSKAKPTQWFQLHPQDWMGSNKKPTGHYGRPEEHVKFLDTFSKEGGVVWLQQPDERIPEAKLYPFDELDKEFRAYETSSFAYQLKMLLHSHVHKTPVSDLYIYGINLTAMDEYAHQKPAVEYWLGRLEQAGVKVHIPAASALLKGPKYARGGSDEELAEHGRQRLQHWKENYFSQWSDMIVGASMAIEVKHWANFFNELAEKFPIIQENEEIKNMVQERLQKRINNAQGTAERAREAATKAHGMVTDNQHWLTMVGSFDQRGNMLPDLRYPNPKMAEDYTLPEARAI